MENKQYVAALEVGSSKIVGAIAEKSSGIITVDHLEREDTKNCVRYGCVQNVENTKASISRMLMRLSQSCDGEIKKVFVGVSGRSLHSQVKEITRPLDASQAVTESIMRSVLDDARTTVVPNYELIDIEPRSFAVDNRIVEAPVGCVGSQLTAKINLLVAKSTLKLNLERALGSGTKAEYIVTPIAVGKNILTQQELSLGSMLVDMGAETTTVSIFKGGSLLYLSTLPLGSRNITLDISTGLNMLEEEAESIKKSLSNPLSTGAENVTINGVSSRDASQYVKARIGEIVANINAQIEYATLKPQDIKSIILIGGGSQMPGLAKYIEENLKIKTHMGEQLNTVNFSNHTYNRAEYIELCSILAEGASRLGDNGSCVERESYEVDRSAFDVEGDKVKAETKHEEKEKNGDKPVKKSKWQTWKTKAIEYLTSESEEDLS